MQSPAIHVKSPLGAQEFWPATGPVYNVPGENASMNKGRTLWSRIYLRLAEADKDDGQPVSPVYY